MAPQPAPELLAPDLSKWRRGFASINTSQMPQHPTSHCLPHLFACFCVLLPLVSGIPLPSDLSYCCPFPQRKLLAFPSNLPHSNFSRHLLHLNHSGIKVLHPMPHLNMALLCLSPNQTSKTLLRHPLFPDPVLRIARHEHWALDRIDQPSLPLDRFHFDPQKCSTRLGANVNIFVIDTGCETSHSSFSQASITSIASPTSSYAANDDNGHGTAVASLLVGRDSGAAPRANVTCVKALNGLGTGRFSDVIAGVEMAVSRHKSQDGVGQAYRRGTFVVLSLSARASSGYVAMDRAIGRARREGVTTFAAAGNDGEDACKFTPGRSEDAVSVGAVDWEDRVTKFSNVGRCVDVVGPGRRVLTARRGGGEGKVSGTSFATPLVAGVVALLWEEGKGVGEVLGRMGRIASSGEEEGYRIATLRGGCHGGSKYRGGGGAGWGWWGLGVGGTGMMLMVGGARLWARRRDRWWREKRRTCIAPAPKKDEVVPEGNEKLESFQFT